MPDPPFVLARVPDAIEKRQAHEPTKAVSRCGALPLTRAWAVLLLRAAHVLTSLQALPCSAAPTLILHACHPAPCTQHPARVQLPGRARRQQDLCDHSQGRGCLRWAAAGAPGARTLAWALHGRGGRIQPPHQHTHTQPHAKRISACQTEHALQWPPHQHLTPAQLKSIPEAGVVFAALSPLSNYLVGGLSSAHRTACC